MTEQKLNSGEQVLLRMNDIWRKTHESIILNQYYNWDVLLDRAWCELVTLMDESEFDKYFSDYEELCNKISKLGTIEDDFEKKTSGFSDISKEDSELRNKQYKQIMEKEIFLRKIQAKVEKKVDVAKDVKREEWD